MIELAAIIGADAAGRGAMAIPLYPGGGGAFVRSIIFMPLSLGLVDAADELTVDIRCGTGGK